MSFLEEVERVQEKLPAQRLSRPMLVGIVCFVLGIIVLTAVGVASTARGDFIVGYSASSSSAATLSEPTSETTSARATSDGSKEKGDETTSSSSPCCVYVVGAVKKPGVYEFAEGSRVNDAVAEAGGFLKSADRTAVNLARPLVDGEQIYIPQEGERTEKDESAQHAKISDVGSGSSGSGDGKVNINTATESELESLPGIGTVMAARIVEDRETQGPFASPEDLMRVSGIGDKKFASIAGFITV